MVLGRRGDSAVDWRRGDGAVDWGDGAGEKRSRDKGGGASAEELRQRCDGAATMGLGDRGAMVPSRRDSRAEEMVIGAAAWGAEATMEVRLCE